ncbi:hypothetical protein [Sphingobium yanoikuyae]|uniref:hypothetical protein n=1 Tax=Sphingobium yanoikuyae TaxID=13690 RepID=UPI00241C4A5E|nr:hypothetical protein [Sphingobium yanoikuyae]
MSKAMNESVIIRASIRLLSTIEGGRRHAISGSYRPNHNFFEPLDLEMARGSIDVPNGKELRPGESAEFLIELFIGPQHQAEIYPGRKWRIQEGATLVGWGTVKKVLS